MPGPEAAAQNSLHALPQGPSLGADVWPSLLQVPATLTVEVAIESLTVRELFQLAEGSILGSSQAVASNVPLQICGRLVAWGEFQVSGENLAVRVAEFR
jgi:flagellar motor switch/type III secretory pathway protein FliN